jgi:hypothetical protein
LTLSHKFGAAAEMGARLTEIAYLQLVLPDTDKNDLTFVRAFRSPSQQIRRRRS